MKQYNAELNTVAVDVALEALFGAKARDEAKRVYELINTTMQSAHALGVAEGEKGRDDLIKAAREELAAAMKQQSDEAVAVIRSAERIGYDKGHAAALFSQAVEKLNAEAAEVSPALAPQAPQEETALVDAVSALG